MKTNTDFERHSKIIEAYKEFVTLLERRQEHFQELLLGRENSGALIHYLTEKQCEVIRIQLTALNIKLKVVNTILSDILDTTKDPENIGESLEKSEGVVPENGRFFNGFFVVSGGTDAPNKFRPSGLDYFLIDEESIKTDIGNIKDFVSKRTDKLRKPYSDKNK